MQIDPSLFRIGFELEFNDASLSSASSLLSGFGQIHFDGTVPSGFEISSPIHLGEEFIGKTISSKWTQMFGIINELGSSTESIHGAGQHVHIERKNFTYGSALAINKFFLAYPDFIKSIGERNFTSYCVNQMGYFDNYTKEFSSQKYSTINLRGPNSPTVEYRFFKTTNSLDKFLKNIQFAIAITAFALEDKLKEGSIHASDKAPLIAFVQWLISNKKTYGNLRSFIEDNKLVKIVPPVKPYHLKIPKDYKDRFYFICKQVKRSCPDYPVVPVASFKSISSSLISSRTDIGLTEFINKEITSCFVSRSNMILMPQIP